MGGVRGVNPCSLSVQHKYTSIAEVQVHMEDEYLRSPLSGVSVGMRMGQSSWAGSWGHSVPPGLLAGLGGLLRWGRWSDFSGAEGGMCGEASGRSRGYPALGVGEPGAEPGPRCWWQLLV